MWRRIRLFILLFGASLPLVLVSSPAEAYMGPGGGFSMLALALAFLGVFAASVLYFLSWPVRATKQWLRRRRESKAAAECKPDEEHPDEQDPEEKR